MPLVVMCGLPCSGKTRRAAELAARFTESGRLKTVTMVGDESYPSFSRDACYGDAGAEKALRGHLKSEVHRLLSKDSLLVLDSLNYIKGYRYELHCLIKAARTPSCVVWCDVGVEEARAWNAARSAPDRYSDDMFDALARRFEAPDSRNRWDAPLFVVQRDDETPFAAVLGALCDAKAPPPNQSTAPQPIQPTDFMYELDRLTQEVVLAVASSSKTALPGDQLAVPGTDEKLRVAAPLTVGQLQRARRQFISYVKLNPVSDVGRICFMFVQYLNSTLR